MTLKDSQPTSLERKRSILLRSREKLTRRFSLLSKPKHQHLSSSSSDGVASDDAPCKSLPIQEQTKHLINSSPTRSTDDTDEAASDRSDTPPKLVPELTTMQDSNDLSSSTSNSSSYPNSSFSTPYPYPTNMTSGSVSTRDHDKDMKRALQTKVALVAEKDYWKNVLRCAVINYGSESLEVARALFGLGGVLYRIKEYQESLAVYKKAVRILRQYHGDQSLPVARALDKVGLAASLVPSQKNLDWALLALHEALQIRYNILGPHHCDVVDTLNNIAGVYLHKREWETARDGFLEVLTVRIAIFGRYHPSVAVTAQVLGKVHCHLGQYEVALKYMKMGLKIYKEETMNLRDSHPLVEKAMNNIASIERRIKNNARLKS